MNNFIRKNILILLLITIFTGIFFYKIDYNTLSSWDEGWYASIARNIVNTGEWIDLHWNGKPYFDHPPFGFWLMAVSYKLFGINEFSTRLPSGIAGVLSIGFLFLLVNKLFNSKNLAFIASIILGTSVWFVIRVRSGNLDAVLVLLFITCAYFAVRAKDNFRWFPLALLSYGALILTKTLIGVPMLIIIFLFCANQFYPKKIWKNLPLIMLGVILLIIMLYPWYHFHFQTYSNFYEHHFINIGARNKTLLSFLNINTEKPLFYLHMGVRKWYDIWLLGVISMLASLSFLKKQFFTILIWNLLILYPFFTSEQTELWHLIPVYIPLAIISAVGPYSLVNALLSFSKQFVHSKLIAHLLTSKRLPQIINVLYLGGFIFIALWQIKIFFPEVYPTARYIPDDVAISKAAGQYRGSVYLDDDYIPLAVYYTGKNITTIGSLPDGQKTLIDFFNSGQMPESDFVVIARNWAVDDLLSKKIKLTLLEKNNSFSIITKAPK